MPKKNDKVYQIVIEVTARPEVDPKRIRELICTGLYNERIKVHQNDDLSYAKFEVLSLRPNTKWR